MKCKVCKKIFKQKSGPGRPRQTHERCKGGNTRKTSTKSKKKTKTSSVRRHSTGSTTRSQKGRGFAGVGTGWLVLYHGGRTGDTQHDKTWAVKVARKGSGWVVVTRHGRRAGQKNETVSRIMTRSAAESSANNKLRSKFRKGYALIGSKRGRA